MLVAVFAQLVIQGGEIRLLSCLNKPKKLRFMNTSIGSINRLILASGSPRRKEFLSSLRLTFEVQVPGILEDPKPNESARDYVLRLAMEKCADIAQRNPAAAVLAADTTVILPGPPEEILGKPIDLADAAVMLRKLSGRTHLVSTAYCLRSPTGEQRAEVISASVEFVELSEKDIEAYVASGEPLDKAGAYAIQGGAARFVKTISGSYTSIVGLPLAEVAQALKDFALL